MFSKSNDLHIVIDTDPGTDDALALALSSVYLQHKINAIISSYGNVNGHQAYINLVNLANLLHIDSVLLQGSQKPLSNKNVVYTNYHGKNGLCGVNLPSSQFIYNNNTIEDLYNIICTKKNIKYISLAPLTNFSRLLESHPDVIQYIDKLIIMGGGLNTYNVANNAEYNFSLDSLAVQKVLKSSVNKVICPLDLTHQFVFTLKEIEDIVGCKREHAFMSTSPYNLIAQIFFKNYDTAIQHNYSGALIHDALTLIYVLNSDKCKLTKKQIKANNLGAIFEANDGYFLEIIQSIDKNYVTNLLRNVFIHLER